MRDCGHTAAMVAPGACGMHRTREMRGLGYGDAGSPGQEGLGAFAVRGGLPLPPRRSEAGVGLERLERPAVMGWPGCRDVIRARRRGGGDPGGALRGSARGGCLQGGALGSLAACKRRRQGAQDLTNASALLHGDEMREDVQTVVAGAAREWRRRELRASRWTGDAARSRQPDVAPYRASRVRSHIEGWLGRGRPATTVLLASRAMDGPRGKSKVGISQSKKVQ